PSIALVEAPATGPRTQPAALTARAASSLRRAQVVLAVAGVIFGVGSTVAYHAVAGLEWLPVRTVALVALLGWVLVPALIATGITDRRAQVGLWAGLLVLTLGLPAATGTAFVEVLQLFVVVVAVPGLVIVLTSGRRIRGVAWLVFPTVGVLAAVALILYVPLTYLMVGVALDRLAWSLVAVAAGLVGLLVVYAGTAAWFYSRKVASDDTLLVLQWWVVLAITQAFLLGTQGWTDAVAAVTPLALMLAFLLVVALVHRPPTAPPVRLLLLRTFGSRRRSSRLLRDLTSRWRWVGSVELITGADLATETLEPHELVDYLTGRLRDRFVRDEGELARRLRGLDLRRDRDGRYRVNELLCHEDTWRPALRALVTGADAVLVDLRALTPANTGVLHEIDQLVALLPLERVVAMTDATTDAATLRDALDRAAALAPRDSPVHADPAPALRTVPATGDRHRDAMALLDALARAATSTSRAQLGSAAPSR
ncbi:hypothetical protein, partial [Georgenia subflava]